MLPTKNKKIDENLVKSLSVNDEVDVIIYGNCDEIIKSLKTLSEDIIPTKLFFINAVAISCNYSFLSKLVNFKCVKKVVESSTVFCLSNILLNTTKINKLHKLGLSGKGVTVAQIDTGTAEHFDLSFPKKRIILFKDFINDKQTPYDDNGHGTFVSGIMCGNGLLSKSKYKGVAYKSNLISIKALNSEGEAKATNILEAMQWVYENAQKYNIKVLCLSFGSVPTNADDPLALASELLWKKGICVVTAAGNSGPDFKTIRSPGISPHIITVGACDDRSEEKKTVPPFSSRGPAYNNTKPDLVAPGVNLISISNVCESPYACMSGTSMAAPIVAGLCALILEKNPLAKPNELKWLIKNATNKIVFNSLIEGAGFLDIDRMPKF